MCAHVVTGTEVVQVADAREDARFAASPFVTGATASVRLYASAPLLTAGRPRGRDGLRLRRGAAGSSRTTQLGLLRDVADPGDGAVRDAPDGGRPRPGSPAATR